MNKIVLRFESTFHIEGDCWLWDGNLFANGYGSFMVDGKNWKAHRWSYAHYIGPIPEGTFVCHTCDNKRCVRPSHLFAGTHTDNMRDMVRKGRNADVRGERNPQSKLTRDQVANIKAWGGRHVDIANRYGISRSMVSQIKRGEWWKSV